MDESGTFPKSAENVDKSLDETKSDTLNVHSWLPASDVPDLISFLAKADSCNNLKDDEEKARNETNEVPLSHSVDVHSLPPASDVPDLISFLGEADSCNKEKDFFTLGNARNEIKYISSTEKCFHVYSDIFLLPGTNANHRSSTPNEEKYLDVSNCNKLLKIESKDTRSKSFATDSYNRPSLPVETPSTFTFKDQSLCLKQVPVNNKITKSSTSGILCSASANGESPDPQTPFSGQKESKDLSGSLSHSFGDHNCNSDSIYCIEKEKPPNSMKDLKISENNTSERQLKSETHSLSATEESRDRSLQMVSNSQPRDGSLTSKIPIEGETENSLKDNFSKTLPMDIKSSNTIVLREPATPSPASDESFLNSSPSGWENYYEDDEDLRQFVEQDKLVTKKDEDEDGNSVASQALHLPSDEHRETPIPKSGSMGNLPNCTVTSDINTSPLHGSDLLAELEAFSPRNYRLASDIKEESMKDEATLSDSGGEFDDGDSTEEQSNSLQSSGLDLFPLTAFGSLLSALSARSSVSRKYGKQTWTSKRKWRERNQICNRKGGCKRQSQFQKLESNDYFEVNPEGSNLVGEDSE